MFVLLACLTQIRADISPSILVQEPPKWKLSLESLDIGHLKDQVKALEDRLKDIDPYISKINIMIQDIDVITKKLTEQQVMLDSNFTFSKEDAQKLKFLLSQVISYK